MNAERAAGPARHNPKLKLKEDIDGLMLIVKKLRQLIDQKDEKIKELENEKIKKISLQAPKPASATKKTQLNNRIKK